MREVRKIIMVCAVGLALGACKKQAIEDCSFEIMKRQAKNNEVFNPILGRTPTNLEECMLRKGYVWKAGCANYKNIGDRCWIPISWLRTYGILNRGIKEEIN